MSAANEATLHDHEELGNGFYRAPAGEQPSFTIHGPAQQLGLARAGRPASGFSRGGSSTTSF